MTHCFNWTGFRNLYFPITNWYRSSTKYIMTVAFTQTKKFAALRYNCMLYNVQIKHINSISVGIFHLMYNVRLIKSYIQAFRIDLGLLHKLKQRQNHSTSNKTCYIDVICWYTIVHMEIFRIISNSIAFDNASVSSGYDIPITYRI